MDTINIQKTIGVGDAGLPFDVSIEVGYIETDAKILVTYWMEDRSPYDNPPELWYRRMEELISDYFYELNPSKSIIFKF